MKKRIISLPIILAIIGMGCEKNSFIDDRYVEPVASFYTDTTVYSVFETVTFTNSGEGQTFVVYTGDEGYNYDVEGSKGQAVSSNGVFSYSYQEPGTYKAVWIASSIALSGEITRSIDSTFIDVVATDGGLESLYISMLCKVAENDNVVFNSVGEFVSADTIVCPVLWAAWNDKSFASIKAPLNIVYELSSTLASLYWYNPVADSLVYTASASADTRYTVDFDVDGVLKTQRLVVKTSSGIESDYFVSTVMIPHPTSFSINGVEATIERDISYYERYNVSVTLPAGTDLTQLKPEFIIMDNDPNLIGDNNLWVEIGGVAQESGSNTVDFSAGTVVYDVTYQMLGETNPNLQKTSQLYVTVITE